MCMTHLVMKALPISRFRLMAKVSRHNRIDAIRPIGYFFATVILALLVYTVWCCRFYFIYPALTLSAILKRYFLRSSPHFLQAHLRYASDHYRLYGKRAGVSNRICSFTIPLANSLNYIRNGIKHMRVGLFLYARYYGLDMALPLQILIVLMSLLTSIGMQGFHPPVLWRL